MLPTGEQVLEDRTLRCILAVAQAGSLRAAARDLGIAPSAVQRTIAAAERRLGEALFERGADGARVTELGRVAVRYALERRDLDALFVDEVALGRSAASGTVRLAVGLGFLEQVDEHVLDPFQRAHPDVTIVVQAGGTDSMVETLVRDDADVAIALHPAPHPRVAVLREAPEPLRLTCAADHPVAAAHPEGTVLAPSDLEGLDVAVMARGFGLRALHDEFLRVHTVGVRTVLETDSQTVLLGAVARGRAVSLLPPVFLSPRPAGRALQTFDIADDHLRAVRSALMVRRDRRLPPASRALLQACSRWMAGEDP